MLITFLCIFYIISTYFYIHIPSDVNINPQSLRCHLRQIRLHSESHFFLYIHSTIHTTQYHRVTILNAGNVKESLFNKMKFEITGVLSHGIEKKYLLRHFIAPVEWRKKVNVVRSKCTRRQIRRHADSIWWCGWRADTSEANDASPRLHTMLLNWCCNWGFICIKSYLTSK